MFNPKGTQRKQWEKLRLDSVIAERESLSSSTGVGVPPLESVT
jgi:hypothetical protein